MFLHCSTIRSWRLRLASSCRSYQIRGRLGVREPAEKEVAWSSSGDSVPVLAASRSAFFAQRLLLLQQELLQGAGQVAHEVPAVGYLQGLRSTLRGRFCVGAAAVPGYDPYLGVTFQPGSHRPGLPVFQQIDHLVALQVHDHGPVAVAAPERPVVYPDDPG